VRGRHEIRYIVAAADVSRVWWLTAIGNSGAMTLHAGVTPG
jgi:hypothetical protein